jgi:hypothetical protein
MGSEEWLVRIKCKDTIFSKKHLVGSHILAINKIKKYFVFMVSY